MEKFKQLQKIKELYSKGENIIQYLKSIGSNEKNTIEDILISYDFQSGIYTKIFSQNRHREVYYNALADLINPIENVQSILEAGVGEATCLANVVKNLKSPPPNILGFDISWSRLKFAKEFLADFGVDDIKLFTANLFEIPLLDNSIDIVYTSHAIEPNGGKEEEALKELYRVAKKYVILLEPSYEFANDEGKARIRKHGFITELYSTVLKLGYTVVERKPFEHSFNPNNPTELIIIKKEVSDLNTPNLVCPISHTELQTHSESFLYSKDSFLCYPVLDGIPCLLKENSILAAHLLTSYENYKLENNIKY